jgi:hypothetical protein
MITVHYSLNNLLNKIPYIHSTIKPTNALYFLSMSNNPTHVSTAIEPSSVVLHSHTKRQQPKQGSGQHFVYKPIASNF